MRSQNELVTQPGALLIGAMKAGTTSIAEELRHHPSVFVPVEKEPNTFLLEQPSDRAAEARRLYAQRSESQIAIDCSTAYSKALSAPSAARHAYADLGPHTRILFVVRDPLQRAISQYRHEAAQKKTSLSLEDALCDSETRFVRNSDYSACIQPWVETFGEEQVKLLDFHRYVTTRQAFMEDVFATLGVSENYEGFELLSITNDNRAGRRLPVSSPIQRFVSGNFYRRVGKQLLPQRPRAAAKRVLEGLFGHSAKLDLSLSKRGRATVSSWCTGVEARLHEGGLGAMTRAWTWSEVLQDWPSSSGESA